jgi:hypothetical protein
VCGGAKAPQRACLARGVASVTLCATLCVTVCARTFPLCVSSGVSRTSSLCVCLYGCSVCSTLHVSQCPRCKLCAVSALYAVRWPWNVM